MRVLFHSSNQTYKFLYSVFFFCILAFSPSLVLGDIVKHITEGDRAVEKKKYAEAETAYAKALEMDPENHRVLKSQAEVKIGLGKYWEAEKLIDKVLAMKVAKGKQVMVTLEGETEPMEAELVDENVLPSQFGKTNMRNYLDPVESELEPHYRFFFLKKGKMELVPKSQARIKYMGVQRATYEQVKELQGIVKMKLIAASGPKGPAEMVSLPAGCFLMGSDKGTPGESPVHEICVSAFKLDKHEVTQRKFQFKMGHNPSRFKGADLPVESVTWFEADEFCRKSGKRLPTEAEWEYAARGGTSSEFYWGDTLNARMANFCDSECELNMRLQNVSDGFKHTAPVGSFPENPLGLKDMAGNVSEWVWDWYMENFYVLSPKNDPKGPEHAGGNEKVVRGGSWENNLPELRSSARKGFWQDYRIEGIGFRCTQDS